FFALMTMVAYITLRDDQAFNAATTEQLQKFVKHRLLPFKYPRRVEYLKSFPKTGTGKPSPSASYTERAFGHSLSAAYEIVRDQRVVGDQPLISLPPVR